MQCYTRKQFESFCVQKKTVSSHTLPLITFEINEKKRVCNYQVFLALEVAARES
jgi:hypothetical protein